MVVPPPTWISDGSASAPRGRERRGHRQHRMLRSERDAGHINKAVQDLAAEIRIPKATTVTTPGLSLYRQSDKFVMDRIDGDTVSSVTFIATQPQPDLTGLSDRLSGHRLTTIDGQVMTITEHRAICRRCQKYAGGTESAMAGAVVGEEVRAGRVRRRRRSSPPPVNRCSPPAARVTAARRSSSTSGSATAAPTAGGRRRTAPLAATGPSQ